jgi:hypothetical protein
MSLDTLIKDVIKHFKLDLSVISLILVNVITLILAIIQKWDLKTIFYIYYFQTIIFSIFITIKLIFLKKELFVGLTDNNNKIMPPTKETKTNIIFGFIGGYFVVFLMYFLFLYTLLGGIKLSFWIITSIFLFFINHLFSVIYNFKKDKEKNEIAPTLIKNVSYRIFVIHFTIWFLGFFGGLIQKKQSLNLITIIILFTLRILVEINMHNREHMTNKDINKENQEYLKKIKKIVKEESEYIYPKTETVVSSKSGVWDSISKILNIIIYAILCFVFFMVFGIVGAIIGAVFFTIIFFITNKKEKKSKSK